MPKRRPRRTTVLLTVAMVCTAIAGPASAVDQIQGNGFSYYVQESEPDRHVRLEDGTDRFELRGGDCYWNGRTSSDCTNGRERVEIRSTTVDPVGSTVCYAFSMLIPSDYPEMSPKQTLGQWHNGSYDSFFNRYENGAFELVLNYRQNLTTRMRIPVSKGTWNRYVYRFGWGMRGDVSAWLNRKKVLSIRDADLLESGISSMYFKYGIYRSDMASYSGTPPVQTVLYRDVRRFVGSECSAL